MTVPTLMANANKQIYVTGLKKAYNQLQHAVAMQKAIEPHEYGLKFTEYLKLKPVTIKDQDKYWVDKNATLAQSKDGMIFMGPGAFDIEYASIGVDINGEKGPNRWGRDRFSLYFTVKDRGWSYGTEVPAGTVFANGSKISQNYFGFGYWKDYCTDANMKKDKSNNWYGQYCAGRILETGKMDY